MSSWHCTICTYVPVLRLQPNILFYRNPTSPPIPNSDDSVVFVLFLEGMFAECRWETKSVSRNQKLNHVKQSSCIANLKTYVFFRLLGWKICRLKFCTVKSTVKSYIFGVSCFQIYSTIYVLILFEAFVRRELVSSASPLHPTHPKPKLTRNILMLRPDQCEAPPSTIAMPSLNLGAKNVLSRRKKSSLKWGFQLVATEI